MELVAAIPVFQEIVKACLTKPLLIALFGAHFVLFSLVAWGAWLTRVARTDASRREYGAFGLFLGALVLEAAQLAVDGYSLFGTRTWGLSRYYGVFAPVLWIWLAWALAALWRLKGRSALLRYGVRGLILAGLGYLLIFQNILVLKRDYANGTRDDAYYVAQKAAKIIRRDYAGPARQTEFVRELGEYYTTRRPVVFSDMSILAWVLRGQSEGSAQGYGRAPYTNDYLFVRAGKGYGYSNQVESVTYESQILPAEKGQPKRLSFTLSQKSRDYLSKTYDFLGTIKGLPQKMRDPRKKGPESHWLLFRRKTTPHH